jgi:hypothetical protein
MLSRRDFQEPDRHIEKTQAERRPGEGVAFRGGCDLVHLAQPAKPVHRCEATAVRPVATGRRGAIHDGAREIWSAHKMERTNRTDP